MEVVASLSQGHTAAAQCGLFTHKSVAVIFEPPCNTFWCFLPMGDGAVVSWFRQQTPLSYLEILRNTQSTGSVKGSSGAANEFGGRPGGHNNLQM